MIDKLIDRIIEFKNPSVVGIDTSLDYLPQDMTADVKDFKSAADVILEFNKGIIDSVCDIVPAVKVQVAYYEMYSVEGMFAFRETLEYAKKKGMIVISDIKRNDIGSTAECYSKAYLGRTALGAETDCAFPSDFVTLNGYLGSDGIKPFIDDIALHGKGAFILAKTSNKSSGELQDLTLKSGETVYEYMGGLIARWGKDSIGGYGYSDIGAVVGATHKKQAADLRAQLPQTFFLIPGYGAQGGKAEDLAVCFDNRGLGGIVNSSRGILCAYKQDRFKAESIYKSARLAAIDMAGDLTEYIKIKR